jgi:hypothetical protein
MLQPTGCTYATERERTLTLTQWTELPRNEIVVHSRPAPTVLTFWSRTSSEVAPAGELHHETLLGLAMIQLRAGKIATLALKAAMAVLLTNGTKKGKNRWRLILGQKESVARHARSTIGCL